MSGLGPRRKRPSRGLSYTPTVSELSAGRTASAAKGGLALDHFGFGVDVPEADFDVLGPKRYEPPAHHVEGPVAGPGIVADHGERVGRRYVPDWRRCVRGRRCGGIDETNLDLADIRGETGTATHGASISGQGREPKRSAPHQRPRSRSSPLDPAHDEIDAAGPSFPRIAFSVCIPGGNSSFQPK
jgi:hypothetical protein